MKSGKAKLEKLKNNNENKDNNKNKDSCEKISSISTQIHLLTDSRDRFIEKLTENGVVENFEAGIDSAVGACNNFSIASEYVVQGNNTWTVSIKDVVNNQNSTSVIFLVDTQVPQISFGTNSIVSGNYSTTLTTKI